MPADRLSKTIRVDQASKFISRDLEFWASRGRNPDFSRPGKPADSASIEDFNVRLRAELT